ncbi:MAG: hypothetical protein OXF01_16445, partial [Gemmatimonadetes bacterium]|nr:hypothetical protein [Gemmatimonadota bacterium]
MTTTRVAAAALVAIAALTCDITEVEGPPADNPDAELELTLRDRPIRYSLDLLWSRGTQSPMELLEELVAYQKQPNALYDDRGAEDPESATTASRDAETAPVIAQLAPQTTVKSDSPREADLVLADEPLVRIGLLDGPDEYLFGSITGAVRLEDGSVVVADESIPEVRLFDAGGRHVWTSGRDGEGPGEYKGLWLLRGCLGATITAYDWQLDRITELDLDGGVADTRVLRGAGPY